MIEGTPQYYYTDVWVGQTFPTYVLTAGSYDLTVGESATIEIDFAGQVDFVVTEIVFLAWTPAPPSSGITGATC